MAALVISISSDVSFESVGSSFLRFILIGSISVEVPVAPEVRAAVVALPARVLELDTHSSLEADTSESSLPLVSIAPMVSPFLWGSIVASRSSSPTTSTSEISTAPILPALSAGIDREEVGHSSSDHSSSGHSILGHSLSGHTPPDTTIADSSTPLRFIYPPLARTPWCSEAYRRWRSPAATVTSPIHATRALVPSHDDLLPPRKRFRGPISLEDSIEEDIDADELADIKADATAVEVAVDKDVVAGVDAGIDMEVDVRFDVEDEVEDKVEFSDRGTMEVGVDVVVGIDIPDGMLMLDAVERLEQVEEVVQDIYGHVMEIPL
ncbi:hypothetical protein Tco_1012146 [Tanacetum coccineum]